MTFNQILTWAACGWCLYTIGRWIWQQWRELRPGREIRLLHKPTGKVIVMPPHYEPVAIQKMLEDLKGLPPFNSPEYKVL